MGYAKFEGADNTPLRPDSPALAGQYATRGFQGRYASPGWYATEYADIVDHAMGALYHVWSCPIFLPVAMTLDQIACEVRVAGAGSTVRLGVYEYDDLVGATTELIVDGGTIDSSTTGIKEVTVSAVVPAGPVLAVAVWQSGSAPSLRGQRGMFGPTQSAALAVTSTQAGYCLNTTALPTGALPSPLAVGATASTSTVRLAVRGIPT